MRALVVVNPAATTTTAKMRDVLVGALASEVKVDVAETGTGGTAANSAPAPRPTGWTWWSPWAATAPSTRWSTACSRTVPEGDLPTLAVVPGGSTNVFSRALGRSRDPVEATAEILASLRAGRTRTVSLGTASATGTGAAADEPGGRHPLVRVRRRAGFDAEVIARVEAQRARGRRSTGALYVREATSAFLLGRERRRPAVTLRAPGADPVEDLFLCLVSNVSPWTYLGARPVNPSPEASFDTGLDVFALGRTNPVGMLRVLRQALAAQPRPRGRGLHRLHDVEEVLLTASRPQGWQVDGDALGSPRDCCCVRSRTLRVVS